MAKSILFVDADSIQVDELRPFLEKRGFVVDWAVDGEDGYEKFNADNYSASIVELFLPKISGNELIKKFREHATKGRFPIVLTSSLLKGVDLDDQTVRERWGADRFLDKPLDPNLLLWSLEELIEQYGVKEEVKVEQKKVEEVVEERPPLYEMPFVVQGIEERGSLKVLGVPELAGWFLHQKKTATLKLAHLRQDVFIYFIDGKPVRIEEPFVDVSLAGALFERGAIPLEDCLLNLKTLELFRYGPQGRIVRTGKLKLADLVALIEDIQKERALIAFDWHEGAFQIDESVPARVEPNITISPEKFIEQALERADSGRLAEIYDDIRAFKIRRSDSLKGMLDQFGISEQAKSLWSNLGTGQSVEAVVSAAGLSPLVAFKALYLLFLLGMVSLEKPIELSQLRALLLKVAVDKPQAPAESSQVRPSKVEQKPAPAEVKAGEVGAKEGLTETPAKQAGPQPQLEEKKAEQLKLPLENEVSKETAMKADVGFRMGINLLRQGNLVDARRELEKAVEALPEEPMYNAYFAWATYQSKLPDYPTAIKVAEKHFKKAVELQPESDAILLLWGKYLKAKGELSKAVVVLTRAVKLNSKNPEAQTEMKKTLAAIAQKKFKEEDEKVVPEEPSLSKLLTKRIIK